VQYSGNCSWTGGKEVFSGADWQYQSTKRDLYIYIYIAVILFICPDSDTAKVECRTEPVVLTEDNVAEFKITDIVLPLPGYDVRYPDNESAAWYRELLAADGFEDFTFQNRVKWVWEFAYCSW